MQNDHQNLPGMKKSIIICTLSLFITSLSLCAQSTTKSNKAKEKTEAKAKSQGDADKAAAKAKLKADKAAAKQKAKEARQQVATTTPTTPSAPAANRTTTAASRTTSTKTIANPINKSADKAVGTDAKGRTIYEGPRGGRYVLTASGNKEYIKKSN